MGEEVAIANTLLNLTGLEASEADLNDKETEFTNEAVKNNDDMTTTSDNNKAEEGIDDIDNCNINPAKKKRASGYTPQERKMIRYSYN
jgi:hypothetical protein